MRELVDLLLMETKGRTCPTPKDKGKQFGGVGVRGQPQSLDTYSGRMSECQESIYYMSGESTEAMKIPGPQILKREISKFWCSTTALMSRAPRSW